MGANFLLLAMLIGGVLWTTIRRSDKALLGRFLLSVGGMGYCPEAVAALLSGAIAGGQFGSLLAGPIGRGIGETMGALLAPPAVVVLVHFCFQRALIGARSSLSDARLWLGFLVIGLTNAGVVWLLLK